MIRNPDDQTPDSLVPGAVYRAELDISHMTEWRWDRDPALAAIGWPPAMKVPGGRTKHRSRRALEQFKANLLQQALAERGKKAAT
jgi:hypothetical protein